ncbi:fumarylacetoacetate hydrolase family protein [Nisaea sp.]|uniref:fumarylacetoacetate hydrolase family protein n=1 Tax=Nisaea sp. TaxID=2024842 RepID=UPI002B266478|nr:fumarylacetoacetate hydrolase family protein [Nisaea sp.]
MRVFCFNKLGTPTLGARLGDKSVDLSIAAPDLPRDMLSLIRAGAGAMETARTAVEEASETLDTSALEFCVPIADPPKVLCVGRNYAAHAKEGGAEPPTYPDIFMRSRLSLIPHNAPIIRPKLSGNLDYECELLIVIGKTARNVTEEDALDCIVGYSLFNDATLRDYQRRTTQWTIGKNFDGTGPIGPEIVTPDELPAGCVGLQIQTRLNGEVMQNANTSDMIFPVAKTISLLSQTMTLEPGDLIATGTPEGVGYARKPPVWMKDGDVVEIEVEGIGILRNPIADER